ncbi:von Willebrand factor type A domain-containing protein [Massilia sp. Mn16-1_5]|uniref:von Willebrand factor type A domain-containing protein n=1 Tax=Massilia sp. Mn16-1_5 TaxID=2079199 RepID=UPI001E3A7AC2|nr:von Willebrand factor type A domain-containing protein [Massilia sp. Mn16-1_5]
MRHAAFALPALAAASLLAACSTESQLAQPAPAVARASPVVPAPAAPQQRVEVSGSSLKMAAGAAFTYAPAPPPPPYLVPHVFRLPGVDKFPDALANKAVLVQEQPVSTFSTDVDTASYAFVRRQLTAGRLPPAAAVRVEEMVNYFPYDYARPSSRSQPFAVTTAVMPSPWKAKNQLLHIAVRGFDVKAAQQPPMNVVLLVDVSGSMGPQDRLPLLK